MLENKKIAIIYDWIDKWGGVERVLLTLHELFPQAEFYTSYFDPQTASWAKDISIRTSFIQKLPHIIKKNRILSLLLYPFAFESLNFNSYDLVISVTSSFAKSVITKPQTKHVCYLLTPARFLWSHENEYVGNSIQKIFNQPFVNYLKRWDLVASQRPDYIISLSDTVQRRCKKYYKRDSQVIYPPFDIKYWQDIKSQIPNSKFQINSKYQILNTKYFLVVSRLEQYKKVDLAVQSFNRLELPLIIVGKRSKQNYLKKIAKKNITFVPYVSDGELGLLYSKAEALIMPQEEDFGYVSLEAQFFGCPVITYEKGGARETILPGKTGLFFSAQNPQSLCKTLEQFHTISYNLKLDTQKLGPKNTERFSKKRFINRFQSFLISNLKNL